MSPPLSLKVSGGSEFTMSLPRLFLAQTLLDFTFSVCLPSALVMQAAGDWGPGRPPEGGQGQGQAVGAEMEEEAMGSGRG